MLQLSEADIIARIERGECFECLVESGAFAVKIDAYAPTVCTAVHAGSRFRDSLAPYCALTTEDRYYEEDPCTDQFIQALPITLVACDSRYEYDLNRPIARCIYKVAWGRTVWHRALPARERGLSIARHRSFYRVLDALVAKLESLFGKALVLDVHSYNHQRRSDETPTFNLGTEQIDLERWGDTVKYALGRLGNIELPSVAVDVATDKVFFGRGYMIAHINSRFENTLVLPLEVKKVYMDEREGIVYPLVLQALNLHMKDALVDIAAWFDRRYTRRRKSGRGDVLAEKLDPSLLNLDRALFALARGLDTLSYINPVNLRSEQKRFFQKPGRYRPSFQYRPLAIDPYRFREQLYRLPVHEIRDAGIQGMYRDVIDALSSKIDMLVRIGQPGFLYESLKYYGEPSFTDEQNANFLLYAHEFEPGEAPTYDCEALCQLFRDNADAWGMACRVESSNRLVAQAMVAGARRTVVINRNVAMDSREARALVHHELGVHMATTLNAVAQPLRVFTLGLPGNTLTQEGLAILNEFQSGNMSLKRLKGLALRVLAVKQMLRYDDFLHTWQYLVDELGMDHQAAFTLAVRVHRGGGFTKDHLYLRGVAEALALHRQRDIANLYVGKTGFSYLPLLDEMVARQQIPAPAYIPPFLREPAPSSPVINYLMSAIRHHGGYRRVPPAVSAA